MDRFATVTHYSAGVSMIMCLTMALAGFLTFGSKTQGNVLNNFPGDNIMVNIARLYVQVSGFNFAASPFLTFALVASASTCSRRSRWKHSYAAQ